MSCNSHDEGKRKIKSVSIRSEDKCFCCRSSQGQLVSCSFCPKSFHASCLPAGISTTKPRWGCPSHKCTVCGMGTSKGRGKLYRCVGCPNAWCYDHLEKEHKPFNGNPFESLGLRVGSYSFVFCARCRDDEEVHVEMAKTQLEEESSEEDRACKRLKTSRGQAKKARRTYPDQSLVDEVKKFMKEYSKLQKDVAQDIGASESVLSQYMHGVQRSNGWNVLENKLVEWMDAVKAAEVPSTPLPASPNRKRKYSEVLKLESKFEGIDTPSPRDSYYSDSDFSASPSHDQAYIQPTSSYQAGSAVQQPPQHYYAAQQALQPQRQQQLQSYPQQYNQQQAFWPPTMLLSHYNANANSAPHATPNHAYYYPDPNVYTYNHEPQQHQQTHYSTWATEHAPVNQQPIFSAVGNHYV